MAVILTTSRVQQNKTSVDCSFFMGLFCVCVISTLSSRMCMEEFAAYEVILHVTPIWNNLVSFKVFIQNDWPWMKVSVHGPFSVTVYHGKCVLAWEQPLR